MAGEARFIVDAADAGMRLDAYLGSQEGMPSRSACVRLIEQGAVEVDGEPCLSKKRLLTEGDRILVELPEERGPLVV